MSYSFCRVRSFLSSQPPFHRFFSPLLLLNGRKSLRIGLLLFCLDIQTITTENFTNDTRVLKLTERAKLVSVIKIIY